MSSFDTPFEGSVPGLSTLEVAHTARSDATIDVYGGRGSGGEEKGATRSMANTSPPQRGWLGNPYEMKSAREGRDEVSERRRVIAAFVPFFLDKLNEDPEFREAVERLRGKRVGGWCRGVSQERDETNWCHLDVVGAWLSGDLRPVYEYLRAPEWETLGDVDAPADDDDPFRCPSCGDRDVECSGGGVRDCQSCSWDYRPTRDTTGDASEQVGLNDY